MLRCSKKYSAHKQTLKLLEITIKLDSQTGRPYEQNQGHKLKANLLRELHDSDSQTDQPDKAIDERQY